MNTMPTKPKLYDLFNIIQSLSVSTNVLRGGSNMSAKILAIKIVRMHLGFGLADSKDMVEKCKTYDDFVKFYDKIINRPPVPYQEPINNFAI